MGARRMGTEGHLGLGNEPNIPKAGGVGAGGLGVTTGVQPRRGPTPEGGAHRIHGTRHPGRRRCRGSTTGGRSGPPSGGHAHCEILGLVRSETLI